MSGEVEWIADLQRERDEARAKVSGFRDGLDRVIGERDEAREALAATEHERRVALVALDVARALNTKLVREVDDCRRLSGKQSDALFRADVRLRELRTSVAALNAHIAADHESMDKLIGRLRVRGLLGVVEGLV